MGWLDDLRWRVMASENEIKRKFEPVRNQVVICKRTDETETAIERQPERLFGVSVRYVQREVEIADIEDEEVQQAVRKKDEKDKKDKKDKKK